MNISIEPSSLKGMVQAPPSKSVAHRMLICGALGCGKSVLRGISSSEDMLATMDCIRALGACVEREGDVVSIEGIGARNANGSGTECFCPGREELPVFACRESGSTLRFFIPIALAVCGGGIFAGTSRLMERGIGIYEELFRDAGISVQEWPDPSSNISGRPETSQQSETSQQPEMSGQSGPSGPSGLRISGALKPGDYKLRGDVSSQFVTGLLFALSLLNESSTIEVLPPVESRAYIDITLDTMRQFGVSIREVSENRFLIPGGGAYQSRSLEVEGDWSNGAFLYAFNAVGHALQISGLRPDSIQGDRACTGFLKQLADARKGEASETLPVIDLSGTPDLGPVLFAAAAVLGGGRFTGTRRLRIKESDRAAAMQEELEKFGIKCHVGDNEVVVEPGTLKRPEVPLHGHNDHRIVMALCVPASLTGAQIEDAQAVRKSWPDFFEVMKKAGLLIH